MNGIMPGPLWLAIASATLNDTSENGTLNHHSQNATVARKNNDSDGESANRRLTAGTNGRAGTEWEETRK